MSLVERQVAILRERNIDMRRRLAELMETARENDRLFTKTRALTLALLDCESWREFNEVLATSLLVEFAADFVTCHVAADELRFRGRGGFAYDHVQLHETTLPTEEFCPGSTGNLPGFARGRTGSSVPACRVTTKRAAPC